MTGGHKRPERSERPAWKTIISMDVARFSSLPTHLRQAARLIALLVPKAGVDGIIDQAQDRAIAEHRQQEQARDHGLAGSTAQSNPSGASIVTETAAAIGPLRR